ncbi:MAG: hypothetical protein K8I03_11980 [Ignavibacteria bacterium]|nr:hypothetical protein [Ignavibacteria bacterium]
MQNLKLVILLRTFSKDEMKNFGRFISSPYFSTGRNLKPLYRLLKKYHPDYNSPALAEEKLFSKLFPAKKFEGKRSLHALSVIFSEMYSMAEKFLQVKSYFNGNVYNDVLLLQELENREMLELFDAVSSKIIKNDENVPRNPSYLLKKLLFNITQTRAGRQRNSATVYLYNQSVINAEESLIVYFLSQLSQLTLARKMNYHKDTKQSELTELFHSYFNYEKFSEALLKFKNEENFLIQMHIYSARLDFDYNDRESYEALKKMIYYHKDNISAEYFWVFSHSLINCCLFQNKGDIQYYKNDYLDLYDTLLKKAAEENNFRFLSRDLLLIKAVYNYAKICAKVNQPGRLEKFLNNYSKYFFEPIKEDSINYAEGYLEFMKGNFRKSLTLFSKTKFTIPMLVKEIKILEMKACYELGYYDLLDAEIDAYRHILATTKEINEIHLNSDNNLMKFVKRLSRIKEKSSSKDLLKLKIEIERSEFKTFHTEWLLKKIEELES